MNEDDLSGLTKLAIAILASSQSYLRGDMESLNPKGALYGIRTGTVFFLSSEISKGVVSL